MIRKAEEPCKYFHQIRAGLEKAISHSGGYVSIGQIFDALNADQWQLYIITDDYNEYVGFGIVEVLNTSNGPWLNLPFVYSSDGLYAEFFGFMGKLAEENGLNGVKFVSSREGFERKAKEFGWRKGFTEWIVEDFRGNK